VVRRIHLLIAVFVAVTFTGTPSLAWSAAGVCSSADRKTGDCLTSASANQDHVDALAERTASEPGISSRWLGHVRPSPAAPSRPLNAKELQALLDEICVGDGACATRDAVALNPLIEEQEAADPQADADDPPRVVTIRDVARFLPAAVAVRAEPDGWAVAGVPANFWVEVRPVTVSASLLGEQAQVQFSPQAYRFDYGDGSTRTTATPGASWAALGVPELSPTTTGHVFTRRAAVETTATVVYSARYRFADEPWIGIAGAVSNSTPPRQELVVVERTALTPPG
jgi:hypothetical protein